MPKYLGIDYYKDCVNELRFGSNIVGFKSMAFECNQNQINNNNNNYSNIGLVLNQNLSQIINDLKTDKSETKSMNQKKVCFNDEINKEFVFETNNDSVDYCFKSFDYFKKSNSEPKSILKRSQSTPELNLKAFESQMSSKPIQNSNRSAFEFPKTSNLFKNSTKTIFNEILNESVIKCSQRLGFNDYNKTFKRDSVDKSGNMSSLGSNRCETQMPSVVTKYPNASQSIELNCVPNRLNWIQSQTKSQSNIPLLREQNLNLSNSSRIEMNFEPKKSKNVIKTEPISQSVRNNIQTQENLDFFEKLRKNKKSYSSVQCYPKVNNTEHYNYWDKQHILHNQTVGQEFSPYFNKIKTEELAKNSELDIRHYYPFSPKQFNRKRVFKTIFMNEE